jgi:DNA-binding NtrC family response regulator
MTVKLNDIQECIVFDFVVNVRSQKKKILVVDDDNDIVQTLKIGLADNGFEVDSYNDPLLALNNFIPNSYDLLITDIRMPEMNGFELYKEIRRIDPRIKVCFFTSFVDYYKSIAENLNLKCFIQKPSTIDEIVEQVRLEIERLN